MDQKSWPRSIGIAGQIPSDQAAKFIGIGKKQASRKEARMDQERLIKCYVKKYGEVPPNNNNFPDKHID